MVIIVQFKSNWPTTILVSNVWSREAIVHKKYISSLAQKLLQKNTHKLPCSQALLHLKKQSEEEKRIRQKIKSHCTASGYYGTWCKYPAFFKFLARPSLQKIDHSKIKQYGRQIDSKEGISQHTHTRILLLMAIRIKLLVAEITPLVTISLVLFVVYLNVMWIF